MNGLSLLYSYILTDMGIPLSSELLEVDCVQGICFDLHNSHSQSYLFFKDFIHLREGERQSMSGGGEAKVEREADSPAEQGAPCEGSIQNPGIMI